MQDDRVRGEDYHVHHRSSAGTCMIMSLVAIVGLPQAGRLSWSLDGRGVFSYRICALAPP